MMVLFCGGYADGRWIEVPDGLKEFSVSMPGDFNWGSPQKVEIKEQRYRIWPIQILGWGMYVAALADRNYENTDVIKTLCQRDVADHLTGRQRVTRAAPLPGKPLRGATP